LPLKTGRIICARMSITSKSALCNNSEERRSEQQRWENLKYHMFEPVLVSNKMNVFVAYFHFSVSQATCYWMLDRNE
jgi:hypothetical protein